MEQTTLFLRLRLHNRDNVAILLVMNYHDFKKLEKYTWSHKRAFWRIERQVLGHHTWRGLIHDADKLCLLYPMAFVLGRDKKWVQAIHRKRNRHHVECPKDKKRPDYIEMIIDWECARYTKPDKPLDAYDTMKQFYPQMTPIILPLLKELNLAR